MIEIAKRAAIEAGKILMEHFRRLPDEAVRRKSRNDFLSFVDEQSEQTILSIIKADFPEHAFMAEEVGNSENTSDYLWIVDPLDGTTNYINGIPVFAISIALLHRGQPQVGVIYDPLHQEMFWAVKGKGAFLNETPIHVSTKTELAESFIATGFPFKTKKFLTPYLETFKEIFSICIGKRRLGAAAIDLAYVAAGRFDGFYEIGLSPWDIAAGALIVEEAGGKITDFWGNDDFLYRHYTLASNGKIHEPLMKIIGKYFPDFQAVY